MSSLNLKLEKIFKLIDFEYVLILGDRSELIPIVHHALMKKKKIIHIGGGEYTHGAIDNDIRYMISQVSHIHFTMHKNYRLNLINLVKKKSKIFNVGYLGLDQIQDVKNNNIKKAQLLKKLKINNDNYVLFTYHPALEEISKKTILELKKIILILIKSNYTVVATHPGMEFKNNVIKSLFNSFKYNKNFRTFSNLGSQDYLNLLKFTKCVIGNSSSGLVEAPYFKVPTINIGNRQKGRIRHHSVLDCDLKTKNFEKKLAQIKNKKFIHNIKKMKYKFGSKNVADKIFDKILNDT
jgi:GDP/UDP-N,N'-diacetylbacillosamine 2-epimerase (hydrolysing)